MNILVVKSEGSLSRLGNLKQVHLDKIKKVSASAKIKQVDYPSPNFEKSISKADLLISSRLVQFDLKRAKKLRWVHITSAGINNLPENILNSDILVTNSSGVHPIPISEHVLAFILMFVRGFNKSFRNQVQRRTWARNYDDLSVTEAYGKTILVVGLGRVGSRVAELAKALGMRVYGVVRNPQRKEKFVDQLVGSDKLDQVLREADFVVNSLPSTEETRGLFNLNRFRKFKKDSFFINIGRGDTVVEKDLILALKHQLIAGAGLDVFEKEPLPDKSPLWSLDNVILTPHYSGWTPYYIDRMVEIFCQNLEAYLKGKKMPNLVDKKLGY